MIRLRIERYPEYDGGNPFDETMVEGLTWYENGTPVGRVIIEQLSGSYDIASPVSGPVERRDLWVPVEVIDEQT